MSLSTFKDKLVHFVDGGNGSFKQEPIVMGPGGGDELAIGSTHFVHKVKSADTNGVFSVIEIISSQGDGVDLHVHEHEDELVYLLEGEIMVTLGDQTMKAVPGVMALLPRGIPHGFTNVGDKPSRVLDTILPGDFDNYIVEMAALSASGELTDEKVSSLSDKYAIKYL